MTVLVGRADGSLLLRSEDAEIDEERDQVLWPTAYIPAAPGWYAVALAPDFEDDSYSLDRLPIVAWRLRDTRVVWGKAHAAVLVIGSQLYEDDDLAGAYSYEIIGYQHPEHAPEDSRALAERRFRELKADRERRAATHRPPP